MFPEKSRTQLENHYFRVAGPKELSCQLNMYVYMSRFPVNLVAMDSFGKIVFSCTAVTSKKIDCFFLCRDASHILSRAFSDPIEDSKNSERDVKGEYI